MRSTFDGVVDTNAGSPSVGEFAIFLSQGNGSKVSEPAYRREKAPLQYTARFIRLKVAPIYLGMDKNLFNRTVRPFLTQIPIGRRGIAFDRLELDQWADQYRTCNGRPALKMEGQRWRNEECQGSRSDSKPMVRTNGLSTNASEDLDAFQAALARAIGRKPKMS